MSFTFKVKEELCRVTPTCSHCDRALLAALVRVEGTLLLQGAGRRRIEVSTDSPGVARTVVRLLHGIYGLATEQTVRRSVLHKTPNFLIQIPDQPKITEALEDMGVIRDGSLVLGIDKRLVEKRCCASAYLRGVFLGSGFIANPRGDFHFELSVENDEFARDIVELMDAWGVSAKTMQRRSSHIVYMKSGTGISEFLALVGAHKCALDMENERVIKSVRNDVNRLVNAELANQRKATDASFEQIAHIQQVLEHQRIEDLPIALQDYIRLRVRNPEATLKELGELADPPLSKSAIYHRVRRIEKLAAEAAEAANTADTEDADR